MQVCVDIARQDGTLTTLVPGDIIGRMRRAALRVNHPAISEAHAMVSLRGSTLRLLALRGRFSVDGQRLAEVVLERGQTIALTSQCALGIVDVVLPPHVLALEVPGLGRLVPPPVASFLADRADPVPGFVKDAAAVIWTDEGQLHVLVPPDAEATYEIGESFEVGRRRYAVVTAGIAEAAVDATESDVIARQPLVLALRYDSVHVTRGGETYAVNGVPARILTELGLIGVPVEWRTVARALWPQERDEGRLRMSWDAGLARIRRRLREIGARHDLVKTDGQGRAELLLGPEDRIVDET